jgi:hypothetical protein
LLIVLLPARAARIGTRLCRRPQTRPTGRTHRRDCLEQPTEGFDELGIGRHRAHLILPQIEVALGERFEIGRLGHLKSL